MPRMLFSHPLLQDIIGVSREIRMLTGPHTNPSSTSKGPDVFPLRLPDVRPPAQYLIDLGLRPALARHLSSLYMDFVSRYRQVFESYFHRVIHDGCQHPENYRVIFLVQFKRTIQVWESQIMSTAWIWLCQAGLLHPHLFPDVRVDAATKVQILLRLGHTKASVVMDNTGPQSIALAKFPPDLQSRHVDPRVQTTEHPKEEEYKSEEDATNMLAASPPPLLKSTSTSTRDPLFQEVPSTCFPAYYPPPPCESMFSPRKPLVTRFLLTTSVNNEKPYANPFVDMPALVTRLGRLSITASNVGRETQDNRKCKWGPKSKKPEPLPPLLSPVVVGQSNSSPRLSSPNAGTISCAISNPAPRKRRIAALPTRHARTTTLPTLDPSSPSPDPPVSALTANNALLSTPQVAKTTVTEAPLDSSPATVQCPPTQAQYTTGTSDNPGSKSVLSKQRKTRPLPRRVASHSQTLPPQTRPSTPLAPSGQRISFSNVSRTPSLVSDTSSSADLLSSSDEFDTPPSTPPSYSHGLTACNALATNVNSKSNRRGPFGLPIVANAGPRRGKGVHIDFTNEDAIRRLSFTFHA